MNNNKRVADVRVDAQEMVRRRLRSRLHSVFNNSTLHHSVRTTVAAMVSLLVARLCGLPEIHWAVISTLIVMQSSLDTSLPIAWRRLAGTALGAATGALLGACLHPSAWVFGVGLFLLGLICGLLGRYSKSLQDKLDRTAYRYAGITLAITLLISRAQPIWIVAIHRFCEVSIGIAVAVVITALWRERPGDR